MSLRETTGFVYRIQEEPGGVVWCLAFYLGAGAALHTQLMMTNWVDACRDLGMKEYIVQSNPELWTTETAAADYEKRTAEIVPWWMAEAKPN